jgi:hypothetical protein
MIQDEIALGKIRKYKATNKPLNQCLVLHLSSIRQNSVATWLALPRHIWNGDDARHEGPQLLQNVLQRECLSHQLILQSNSLKPKSTDEYKYPIDLLKTLALARHHHENFLTCVSNLPEFKLLNQELLWDGSRLKLLSFLLNIGMAEALDCGKLVKYLRPIT